MECDGLESLNTSYPPAEALEAVKRKKNIKLLNNNSPIQITLQLKHEQLKR
jgi:hypothetical protein